jgi:hypothetical protein
MQAIVIILFKNLLVGQSNIHSLCLILIFNLTFIWVKLSLQHVNMINQAFPLLH